MAATTPPAADPATPPRRRLTPRQAEILAAIVRHWLGNGVYPTFREVMADVGISSPNGLKVQLLALRKKGWVSFDDAPGGHKARARSAVVVGLWDLIRPHAEAAASAVLAAADRHEQE
jgi:SOS-response transcriptional repressor LexA